MRFGKEVEHKTDFKVKDDYTALQSNNGAGRLSTGESIYNVEVVDREAAVTDLHLVGCSVPAEGSGGNQPPGEGKL